MNRTSRLSKSGIEYLTHTWGFSSGCHNWENGICPVGKNCWAKKTTQRFPSHYPNGFEPTFYPEAFMSPLFLKKPSIIGCGFMGDLFLDEIDPNKKIHAVMPSGKASITMSLKGWIFTTIEQCPQHRFLFLTKCPWNLIRWSPFPENCWVGVTATSNLQFLIAIDHLSQIDAHVKFISFEPLLNEIGKDICLIKGSIDWPIIGACTGTLNDLKPLAKEHPELALMPYGNKWTLQPKLEWVLEIVAAASKARIPVFLKTNLVPMIADSLDLAKLKLYPDGMHLRQEMPK